MNELTETHKRIIQALVEGFINTSEMPDRRVFRAEHSEHLADMNYLEKTQVLQTDAGKYKISLKFFKESNIWQKEKRVINKILKTLAILYKNNPLAEFPIASIIPKDEYALQPSGTKRALYFLREAGLLSGGRQDPKGDYSSVSPHEDVLIYDDIDKKIDAAQASVHEELAIQSEEAPRQNSVKEKTWRIIKELGEGGQGKVSLVEKLSYHNEVVNKVVGTIRKLVASEKAEIINKEAYSLPLFFSEYADDLQKNKHRGALKQLHASGDATYRKALERMEKEIAGMEEISHPNIVKILDKNLNAGWFVMEYFEHGSLDKHLDLFKGNALRSLHAFRNLVEAVAMMHSRKLIHRDIKPQNIYVRAPMELIIGDLGLIFMQGDDRSRISETYENVGSRDWMPMWAQGKILELVNPSFDVFGLAKILWTMISGKTKLPFYYYDHDEYNLERLFPGKDEMSAINTLFSKCIVEHEKDIKIKNAVELLNEIDKTLRQVEIKAPRLVGNTKRHCQVCGIGIYTLIVDRNPTAAHNFGISPTGNSGFKIYTCNNCGHAQLFYFQGTDAPLPAWEGDIISPRIHREARGQL